MITGRIKGWNRILQHKCHQNQIIDPLVINYPDSLSERETPEQCSTFVYSAFLEPGYHKFLIYDPKSRRAFCKELMVGLNQRDTYSDFPACIHDKFFHNKLDIKRRQQTKRNIWLKWQDLREQEDLRDMVFFDDMREILSSD